MNVRSTQQIRGQLPLPLWERVGVRGRALALELQQRWTARRTPNKHTVYAFTDDGRCLAARVILASSFYARFIGLLGHRKLDSHEGMLLVPGGTIHTFGMRFAIDVVFLDHHMRMLKVVPALKPWRVSIAPRQTHFVLEMRAYEVANAIVPGSSLLRKACTAQPSP